MNVLLIAMPDCTPYFEMKWMKTPTNNLPLDNPDAFNGDNHIDLDDVYKLA